ncbi:MAG: thiamine-phosphate kinase, partial [Calditrichaeota bacterium]|nr:thiamine-phosphate kinase [Calditrichota bacterium]
GNHVSAMIDVSDGIASDLYHICTSSNVGAVIYQNQLPLPRFLEEVSEFSGKDITELALHRGEDYELLFTASHNKFPQIQQDISENLRLAITKIGNIVSREKGYMLIDSEGKEEQLQPRGWDHFRDS